MIPTKTSAFKDFTWNVNTPQFIKEAAECNNGGMYAICWNIFKSLLAEVAQRAAELHDPVMDALMLKLNLYEVPNEDRWNLIKELKDYYNKELTKEK